MASRNSRHSEWAESFWSVVNGLEESTDFARIFRAFCLLLDQQDEARIDKLVVRIYRATGILIYPYLERQLLVLEAPGLSGPLAISRQDVV